MKRRITAIAILTVLSLGGVVWARMTTVVVAQGVASADTTAPTAQSASIGTNGTALMYRNSSTGRYV